jgi:hypothetical protein
MATETDLSRAGHRRLLEDRESMLSDFDLWSHKDVAGHADAILGVLEAGSMPCDGAWPDDQIGILRRWVESGTPA